jgi:hypothetical protein
MTINPYQPPGTESIDPKARQAILGRWLALKRGDGIVRARRVHAYLVLAAFVIFVPVFVASAIYDWHPLVTMVPAILVGWLIAEANALKYRLDHVPIYREYIDWAKVERDYLDPTS